MKPSLSGAFSHVETRTLVRTPNRKIFPKPLQLHSRPPVETCHALASMSQLCKTYPMTSPASPPPFWGCLLLFKREFLLTVFHVHWQVASTTFELHSAPPIVFRHEPACLSLHCTACPMTCFDPWNAFGACLAHVKFFIFETPHVQEVSGFIAKPHHLPLVSTSKMYRLGRFPL